MWPVLGTMFALTLAAVLLVAFPRLFADMRQDERDLRDERARAWRYGGSLSWNDETPASLESNRGPSATPHVKE